MKNIEKLARYLGTKQNPDQILEFFMRLPLDQRGGDGLTDARLADEIMQTFEKR